MPVVGDVPWQYVSSSTIDYTLVNTTGSHTAFSSVPVTYGGTYGVSQQVPAINVIWNGNELGMAPSKPRPTSEKPLDWLRRRTEEYRVDLMEEAA